MSLEVTKSDSGNVKYTENFHRKTCQKCAAETCPRISI